MAKTIELKPGQLVINYKARDWCRIPYLDHPHGCPNYNHRKDCPPTVCKIEDFLNLKRRMWLVVIEFDLGSHMKHMKELHRDWSERQLRNVYYWQNHVNMKLKNFCLYEVIMEPDKIYTTCPEAMGVHVIQTAKDAGVPIEIHPKETVYKIGLVGYKI